MLAPLHSAFNSLFPPPRFLSMPAVGLDIADRRVRFLEFAEGRGGLVVARHGKVAIPEDVIQAGTIQKPERLAQILRSFREEHDLQFVVASLPEERVYLVKMDVPVVDKSELRNSIMFQLEEYIPISPQDAVFDYEVISEPGKGAGTLQVAVAAISRAEVESYLAVFEDTGIVPIDLEIEAQATARALIPWEEKGAKMIVDFGRERTGVSVAVNGLVRFTSTVDVGSNMLTRAIMKHFSVDEAEADRMKNERGITRGEGNEEFFLAVVNALSILRDEVNKLFLYWHTHRRQEEKGGEIKRIVLCGGGANLKGLTDYLSSTMRMPVEVGNPWVNVNSFERYIPEIPYNESLGYAAVLGLALKAYKRAL